MKTKLLITLVLFFFFSCAKQELLQMSPQQQETEKKEIKNVINQIFQNLEKLDAEAAFQPYLNTPDFILFTVQGSMADYQGAKNGHAAWFKTLTSIKVTTLKEEFRFLPDNLVIYPWLGKFEMTPKSGEQLAVNFGVTMIFRKIDNQWKVIYQQTAQVPPVQERPKE